MISSMTGYGRGAARQDDLEVSVELRTVNNRYLDISLKMPRAMADFEQQVRDLVGKHLTRGRVSMVITLTSSSNTLQNLSINKPLAETYLRLAKDLQEQFGLPGQIEIAKLLEFPDIIVVETEKPAEDKYWLCLEKALTQALQDLQNMRRGEGDMLRKDFEARISNLDQLLMTIENMAVDRPRKELEKLRQRVESILEGFTVDQGRLEQELAMIADRLDITEECVRFHSHNQAFMNILASEASPGRKLNFLLQEMQREVNTMGNKAAMAAISHLVVQIKDEIEKLREQVQNIE